MKAQDSGLRKKLSLFSNPAAAARRADGLDSRSAAPQPE